MLRKSARKDKDKPKWLFGFKEAEGRKHRMVRTVEGEKKLHCMICGLRSLFYSVLGVYNGLKGSLRIEKEVQTLGAAGRISFGRASHAAYGRCGKGANFDLLWKVRLLGIGE